MISEGHSSASKYPIWLLFAEAELIVERKDREAAQTARLTQLAMASAQGSKKAKKILDDELRRLTRT